LFCCLMSSSLLFSFFYCLLCAVLCYCLEFSLLRPAIDVDLINSVNCNAESKWIAGESRLFKGKTLEDVRSLCGALSDGPALPVRTINTLDTIPDSFDAREEWGGICPSLNEVRDQAACGSCWAFGAVEAMTDRTCIASRGTNAPHLSVTDIVACCGILCGFGCSGGFPASAWLYWVIEGVVTGGNYGSSKGCYPYPIPSCEHHVNGSLPPCGASVSTPSCNRTCQNGASWSEDKHFGVSSYRVSSTESEIQTEIMTHGPVEAAFTVYSDFLLYQSGVYHHIGGEALGGHAVKLLGWGVQGDTPYWWTANSWNADWGDHGFFKIRRGIDECGIESQIMAGLPKV